MTTEHDDYWELPAITPGDRLDLENMCPWWFLLSQREWDENRAIRAAIHPLVSRYVPDADVMRVTEAAMIAIKHTIRQALIAGGDVTASG